MLKDVRGSCTEKRKEKQRRKRQGSKSILNRRVMTPIMRANIRPLIEFGNLDLLLIIVPYIIILFSYQVTPSSTSFNFSR